MFVKHNQLQLLTSQLPKTVIPVGTNKSPPKILKEDLRNGMFIEEVKKLRHIPGDLKDHVHAQERPKRPQSLSSGRP